MARTMKRMMMMMATTRLRATILSCESFEVMRAARACEVVDVVEGVRERARRVV